MYRFQPVSQAFFADERTGINDENVRPTQHLEKPTMKLFHTVAMIGQGGYAIVRVVRHKFTGKVYAIKQIAKCDFVHVSQLRMAVTEAEILSARSQRLLGDADAVRTAVNKTGSLYFPEFYGAWQDEFFIYFLMEYLPGGDLMKHLIDRETFPESVTQHYIAQLAVAVGYLHDTLGFSHRDLKPDNVLFDAFGHIKLLDFGLSRGLPAPCGPSNRRPLVEAFRSAVGTPDYMAPEVHRHDGCHNRTVDWWSLGIIMYEMLYGGPPLSDCHHRAAETAELIRHWKQHLTAWPARPKVSNEAKDFMLRLIAEEGDRYKSVEEVFSHPWLAKVDIYTLRQGRAPIVPETRSKDDTRNFDDFALSRLREWEQKKRVPTRSDIAQLLARERLIPLTSHLPAVNQRRAAVQADQRKMPGQFTGVRCFGPALTAREKQGKKQDLGHIRVPRATQGSLTERGTPADIMKRAVTRWITSSSATHCRVFEETTAAHSFRTDVGSQCERKKPA